MKFERKRIAVALAYALGSTAVVAVPAALAQQAVQLDRIEVTGTSIRRVEAETALPVTIVTREEIARTGVTTTEDLLRTLPAISTLGSLGVSSGAGLGTYGQSSASLRGLGSTRTLVLVNGRRLAAFAGDDGSVNVNSIPVSAIERVEVLRDGASAIYGSDAMAGVLNFILNKDFEGVEVGGQYGTPTDSGGGSSWNAHIVGGWGTLAKDKFNVTASLAYNKEKALFGADREYAASATKLPYYSSGATGLGNIEGAFVPGTGSAANGTWKEGTRVAGFGNSPGAGYGNPLAATNQCESIDMRLNSTKTSKGAPYCNFDTGPFVGLVPETERWNASLSFVWQMTPDVQLFADGLYSTQTNIQTFQPSPVRRSFNVNTTLFDTKGIDRPLLIYPANPNYKIAADYLNAQGFGSIVGQPLAITSRVFDFGGRQSTDDADQWRALIGLRGTAWKQDWEVAYYHNENKVKGSVTAGYFSLTEYAKVVQTSNDWNPWSLTQTPEFNAKLPGAIYIGPTLTATTKSDAIDSKISGEVMALPAGPLQYAAGFQWNKNGIVLDPAPAQFTGDIAGLGGATVALDVDRTITAGYGELNIPIVKTLEATLAGRYDHYSDVGGKFTYYGNLRWQPSKEILGRAAYGTGFRAPTLSDLYYPILLGTSAQFDDPVTGETDLQVNEYTGANPNLKPEKSKQTTVGLVWQPMPQFSASIDWFRVKLDDIIATPTTQDVVSGNAAGNPAYAGAVVRDASGSIETVSSQTVNAGKATVEGFDVALDWRQTYSWGTPIASLAGTYMSKWDQTTPGGVKIGKVATQVQDDGSPVPDADTGGVVPRWKHAITLGYGYGGWEGTVTQNYYRSYRVGNDLNGDAFFVGNTATYDMQISYRGIKNLNLAFGIRNFTNDDPPLYISPSNQFQSGYDITMYDPRGRFIYGQVSYKFDVR